MPAACCLVVRLLLYTVLTAAVRWSDDDTHPTSSCPGFRGTAPRAGGRAGCRRGRADYLEAGTPLIKSEAWTPCGRCGRSSPPARSLRTSRRWTRAHRDRVGRQGRRERGDGDGRRVRIDDPRVRRGGQALRGRGGGGPAGRRRPAGCGQTGGGTGRLLAGCALPHRRADAWGGPAGAAAESSRGHETNTGRRRRDQQRIGCLSRRGGRGCRHRRRAITKAVDPKRATADIRKALDSRQAVATELFKRAGEADIRQVLAKVRTSNFPTVRTVNPAWPAFGRSRLARRSAGRR